MQSRALGFLRTYLKNPEATFRPDQWECIESLLAGRRLLVVQRTGWGKSMVYFLATRLLRDLGKGPTLLISPLLSLMRNQIQAARTIGIRTDTINSTNKTEWSQVLERLRADEVDLLLISPERLANEQFRQEVLASLLDRVGLFVVDEAHCISDWGHDFRPDYRRIARILQILPPNISVLATTATANHRVTRDVADQLGNLRVVRGPLRRDSLSLQTLWLPSPTARMAWLAGVIPSLPGSGIVYVLTRRDADRVAQWLRQQGIVAQAYYSTIEEEPSEENSATSAREELEDKLLRNEIKVLVATIALGMGFDKPDLGFVIHFQRPASVVHYYQQVGRAGRALRHAYGVLLSGEEDDSIADYFLRAAFPPQKHVEMVLNALNKAQEGLSMRDLQEHLNLSWRDLEKTLKYLSVENPSPVVRDKSRWRATPVHYQMDLERIHNLCDLRRAEQQEMRRFLNSKECLMQFLAKALDDPDSTPCGRCAACLGRSVVPMDYDREKEHRAAMYLRRCYLRIEPRKRWPPGAFTEYSEFQGKILPDLMAHEGRALSLWGDGVWGEQVRGGKYEHKRFSDELVEGCAEMLCVWNPDPRPTWITCVASHLHPELIRDFAARLAQRLNLPFAPAIEKIKNNQPQKAMLNSCQQAKNLDGVFRVNPAYLSPGPVLLVDDMVDSRWTFTVLAALLRKAGCQAVHPLALAMNTLEA